MVTICSLVQKKYYAQGIETEWLGFGRGDLLFTPQNNAVLRGPRRNNLQVLVVTICSLVQKKILCTRHSILLELVAGFGPATC